MWNLTAECISGVFATIIFIYSRQGNFLRSLKNCIFQICLATTLCSIGTNVLSTIFLYHHQNVPSSLIFGITTIYFLATPLMGTVYFFYILSMLYEDADKNKLVFKLSFLPYAVYLLIVLSNGLTGWIFYLDSRAGYQRGPLIFLTYLVFYIYCALSFVFILVRRRYLEQPSQNILLSFPLIAVLVIFIQQLFPQYILTGSAATCALLIIYLYFQNKRISVDFLTGMSNRQVFLKMIELKMKAPHPAPFSVIVVSMNEFKFFNDKFGQHVGDLMLQKISGFLKTLVPFDSVYRYSGDQFALILSGAGRAVLAQPIAQLKARLDAPWEIEGYPYRITYSVGIVCYPDSARDTDGFINGIEYALSTAKADKLHQFAYCTPAMLDAVRRKHEILEILKENLANDGFEVYFQPVYSLQREQFVLAESLLRLNHTRLGALSPAEFIPIAEESGLIIDITYRVLEQACRFLKAPVSDVFEGVSVNLSVVQFMQDDLAERMLQIIAQNDITPSRIKIEITESVLATSFDKVSAFIHTMSSHGIRFGLDDFGTGYSNFSSVFRLPFDIIKFDKSLVWAGVSDEKSAMLMRALARTFDHLGVRVLAEGVETEEQRAFVSSCGCDLIQGFYYARPMPAEKALQMIGQPQYHTNE